MLLEIIYGKLTNNNVSIIDMINIYFMQDEINETYFIKYLIFIELKIENNYKLSTNIINLLV